MAEILRFFQVNEIIIYIILALGGIVTFRWLWKAWRDWRNAIFGLEREIALRRLNVAIAASVLIVVFLCAEIGIVSFLAPSLPASSVIATPTLNLLAIPTGTMPADLATALAQSTQPSEQNSVATGCVDDQLIFIDPSSGQTVSGNIDLVGTVDIPNFGFYKYEFSPQGSETWTTILAGRSIRRAESLGNWDTTDLTPGDYLLRLVVTDNVGQSLPPCAIPIRVEGR